MNYQRIYLCIVLRAQREHDERKANKKNNGAYYEVHHIIPRSLNGTNCKNNLAMLTAREHFICHWLLVKMYPKGSVERYKMLCALWRMNTNPTNESRRYINSKVYELLRIEYAKVIGTITTNTQKGKLNSRYGSKWYTSYITGESKVFFNTPYDTEWIKGRNIFHGQTSSILYLLNGRGVPPKNCITKKHYNQSHKYIDDQKYRSAVYQLWDEFHSSSCKSLTEFAKFNNVSEVAIRKRFNKFIPLYSIVCHQGKRFMPNVELIGKYDEN